MGISVAQSCETALYYYQKAAKKGIHTHTVYMYMYLLSTCSVGCASASTVDTCTCTWNALVEVYILVYIILSI